MINRRTELLSIYLGGSLGALVGALLFKPNLMVTAPVIGGVVLLALLWVDALVSWSIGRKQGYLSP